MTPTLDEFKNACRRECAFLTTEYQFQELPESREYNDFSVLFRNGILGIDVYGEGYGKLARCDLTHAEAHVGLFWFVPTAALPPWRRRSTPTQLEQIATIGALLRAHCADFLSGDLARFHAAFERWEAITRPRPVSQAQQEQRAFDTACSEAGHAFKRGDYLRVVELLAPHAGRLGRRHAEMIEIARRRT